MTADRVVIGRASRASESARAAHRRVACQAIGASCHDPLDASHPADLRHAVRPCRRAAHQTRACRRVCRRACRPSCRPS